MLKLFQPTVMFDREWLIRDIATQAARGVLQRLGADTAAMSAAELRGYVRARATTVVHAQIQRAQARGAVHVASRNTMVAAILERTVHLVVANLQVQPVTTIQAPHIRLRIAA